MAERLCESLPTDRARGGDDTGLWDLVNRACQRGMGQGHSAHVFAELQHLMAKQRGEQMAVDNPAPYTVRWYVQNADEKVLTGSEVTVRQAAYFIAHHSLKSGSTEEGAELLCGFLHSTGLLPGQDDGPPGTNKMPRSPHFVRGILQIGHVDEYAFDMCGNNRCPTVFGRSLPPEEAVQHQGQRCSECGFPRYIYQGARLMPARR